MSRAKKGQSKLGLTWLLHFFMSYKKLKWRVSLKWTKKTLTKALYIHPWLFIIFFFFWIRNYFKNVFLLKWCIACEIRNSGNEFSKKKNLIISLFSCILQIFWSYDNFGPYQFMYGSWTYLFFCYSYFHDSLNTISFDVRI